MKFETYMETEMKSLRSRGVSHFENGMEDYAISQYLQILKIFNEQSRGQEKVETFKETFDEIYKEGKYFAHKGEARVLDYLVNSGLLERFS